MCNVERLLVVMYLPSNDQLCSNSEIYILFKLIVFGFNTTTTVWVSLLISMVSRCSR